MTDKRKQLLVVLQEKIERLINLKRNVVSLREARGQSQLTSNNSNSSSSTSRSRSESSDETSIADIRYNSNQNSNTPNEESTAIRADPPSHVFANHTPVNHNSIDEVLAQALVSMLSVRADIEGIDGEMDADFVEDVFVVREYARRREELERRELPRRPSSVPRDPLVPSPSILVTESGRENHYSFILHHCSLIYVDLYDLVRYTVLAVGIPAFTASYF